jgi:hypothetical protein
VNTQVAFGLGVICGLAIMGFFCDWIMIESQRVLDNARKLQEDAVRIATPHTGGTDA